jgi:hypothetical protein
LSFVGAESLLGGVRVANAQAGGKNGVEVQMLNVKLSNQEVGRTRQLFRATVAGAPRRQISGAAFSKKRSPVSGSQESRED